MTVRQTPLGELRLVREGERTGFVTCYACSGPFDIEIDSCTCCGRSAQDLIDLRAAVQGTEQV